MSNAEGTAARVIDALVAQGLQVASAESLTGGALCSALVSIPGASQVVRGGVIAYATDVKHSVLQVDAALLAEHGPVHEQVAAQMAQGVRQLLGAEIGVATTGVAGPGAADGHPAGTVFVAVAGPGEVHQGLALSLPGNRAEVRAATVQAALELVLRCLGARPE